MNYYFLYQVMIDFQGAERKRLEEPASEIGLEPLCAMVCKFCIYARFNRFANRTCSFAYFADTIL